MGVSSPSFPCGKGCDPRTGIFCSPGSLCSLQTLPWASFRGQNFPNFWDEQGIHAAPERQPRIISAVFRGKKARSSGVCSWCSCRSSPHLPLLYFSSLPAPLPPGAASWWDRSKKRGELIKARALPAKTWDCRVPVTAPGSPAPTPGRCERIFYPHQLGKRKSWGAHPCLPRCCGKAEDARSWERQGMGGAGSALTPHKHPSDKP